MRLTTLDEIIRRGLLESGLPVHWYAEFLFHGSTCLRELNFDTLQIINTVNLPVNSYGAADLPDDFCDDLAVCSNSGSVLIGLPKQDWLTPLRIHSTDTGEFVSYPSIESRTDNDIFGFSGGYNYYWNVDSYSGFTGRNYGANGGTLVGYKIVKERRQIQMTSGFENTNIILQYISNGQSIDNATQIEYAAFQTIRAFQEWKRSPNANNHLSMEARNFNNQKRMLRSRLNPLTPTDILNIFRSAYSAAAKT